MDENTGSPNSEMDRFRGALELQEAIFANTSIKFAGGASAKDARTMAAELRTEPAFLEGHDRHSFAVHIKGTTKNAVSTSVPVVRMEKQSRKSKIERAEMLDEMRRKNAVHHSEVGKAEDVSDQSQGQPEDGLDQNSEPDADTGEPMSWK